MSKLFDPSTLQNEAKMGTMGWPALRRFLRDSEPSRIMSSLHASGCLSAKSPARHCNRPSVIELKRLHILRREMLDVISTFPAYQNRSNFLFAPIRRGVKTPERKPSSFGSRVSLYLTRHEAIRRKLGNAAKGREGPTTSAMTFAVIPLWSPIRNPSGFRLGLDELGMPACCRGLGHQDTIEDLTHRGELAQ